ncbi:hypothetical protein QBC42DRAFT_351318 [Cladorrhinum samala]|uniref:Uncharacterized protein n=1 Tax=Cladorrhinum samala TaxID=585594 RepID=A0AAV9H7E7_9PEZI|nr:hypothetical protein QBC42DRAFT_351318 [Cladorrhinum samala]
MHAKKLKNMGQKPKTTRSNVTQPRGAERQTLRGNLGTWSGEAPSAFHHHTFPRPFKWMASHSLSNLNTFAEMQSASQETFAVRTSVLRCQTMGDDDLGPGMMFIGASLPFSISASGHQARPSTIEEQVAREKKNKPSMGFPVPLNHWPVSHGPTPDGLCLRSVSRPLAALSTWGKRPLALEPQGSPRKSVKLPNNLFGKTGDALLPERPRTRSSNSILFLDKAMIDMGSQVTFPPPPPVYTYHPSPVETCFEV